MVFAYYGRHYCPFPSLDAVSNFIPSEKKARLHVYRAQTVGHLTTTPVSSSDTTGDIINIQLTPWHRPLFSQDISIGDRSVNENDKTSLTSNKCVVIVIVIRKVQLFDNEFFQATSEEEFSFQTNWKKNHINFIFQNTCGQWRSWTELSVPCWNWLIRKRVKGVNKTESMSDVSDKQYEELKTKLERCMWEMWDLRYMT